MTHYATSISSSLQTALSLLPLLPHDMRSRAMRPLRWVVRLLLVSVLTTACFTTARERLNTSLLPITQARSSWRAKGILLTFRVASAITPIPRVGASCRLAMVPMWLALMSVANSHCVRPLARRRLCSASKTVRP